MLQITKPTLLLDKSICLNNIQRMAIKAMSSGLTLRPHCKTHQSREIANWFRDFGVSKITVSSLDMAAYFTLAGWQDILIAFPFNPLEINRLNELASISRISVLADNAETLVALQKLEKAVGLYIDIDPGYGRTGIPSDQCQQIEDLIHATMKNPKLDFSGFYCHAGHSYKARNQKERDEIHRKALSDLSGLKRQFTSYDPSVLYGDTPNCSIQSDFQGVDEITPGNFVFYDLTQAAIGSCRESDIAVAVACPVVGKHIRTQEIVIHGGAVHFSKERLESAGKMIYGKLVHFSPAGWSPVPQGAHITSLSQEHGVVAVTKKIMDDTRIGDLLAFHPVHSCLTANLMKQYTTLEGHVISMHLSPCA
jgi:D-serine deaminase-like pyridoxal phosphate-dependent protein